MSEEESAVLATTGKISTLADGSFRLVLEIEPRHAQAAFRLFGTPGTPVAIARVMPEVMLREDRQHTEERNKGGALARLAGQWCGTALFLEWLGETYQPVPVTSDHAARIIRGVCKVESRAELDHDDAAEALFHQHFRLPYQKWLKER